MNRILKRSIRKGRLNSEYYAKKQSHVVTKADCKVKLRARKIVCKLKLPTSLELSSLQEEMLREEIYHAVGAVVSKYLGAK